MGYESKIIVVDRKEHKVFNNNELWVFGDEIMQFDLSKMGNDIVNGCRFVDIFTKPIDFNLYLDRDANSDEEHRIDCYGEHCKYTDVQTVIDWLSADLVNNEFYRREAVLLDALCGFQKWKLMFNELCVVHYGY